MENKEKFRETSVIRPPKGIMFSKNYLQSVFGLHNIDRVAGAESMIESIITQATQWMEAELERALLLQKRQTISLNHSFPLEFPPIIAIESVGYRPRKKKKEYHHEWTGERLKEVVKWQANSDTHNDITAWISIPPELRSMKKDIQVHVTYWAGHVPSYFNIYSFLGAGGDGHVLDDNWEKQEGNEPVAPFARYKAHEKPDHHLSGKYPALLAQESWMSCIPAPYLNSVLYLASDIIFGRFNPENIQNHFYQARKGNRILRIS